jgi:hypothetical protein
MVHKPAALATALILAVISVPAHADAILDPTAVSTAATTAYGAPANLINQSGLSASYVSGQTDFATYAASTTVTGAVGDIWSTSASNIPIDLVFTLAGGADVTIDGLALWSFNAPNKSALRNFTLFASDDPSFSSGVTDLGDFVAAQLSTTAIPAQTFLFADTTAAYIDLEMTDNYGGGNIGFNEVAFAQTVPVPEPASIMLFGAGAGGSILLRRRRPGHQRLAA